MDRKTELVTSICKEIARGEDINRFDWESVSIVIKISPGHVSNKGYLYDSNGQAVSTYAESKKIFRLAMELQTVTHVPGEDPWQEMLVQIRRLDGRIKVDFHYGPDRRWAILPSNLEAMMEELRPAFD